jgi:hypothetical protein
MQERKPSNKRSAQASRGPAGPREEGVGLGALGVELGFWRVGAAEGSGAEEGEDEGDGDEELLFELGAGVAVLPGALARRWGEAALGAEAARAAEAAAETAEAAGKAPDATDAVLVLEVDAVAVMAVAVEEPAEALVALVSVFADGVLTVAVAVVGAGSGLAGAAGGLALRVNQKPAAPTANAARPISAQGLPDLAARAEGGNMAGAVSSGMAFMPCSLSACSGADAPKPPGVVMGNCVGANCVLAPYSESL